MVKRRSFAAMVCFLILAAFILPSSYISLANDLTPSELAPLPVMDASCKAMVDDAFTELGTACAGIGPNSICYHDPSSVQFADQREIDTSANTKPELALLTNFESYVGRPPDPINATWSLAVLNVQANLPASLSGQQLRILAFGEVQITNEVDPKEALVLAGDPVPAMTVSRATLYQEPTRRSDVVGTVPSETALSADGLSENREWVRVYYEYALPSGEQLGAVAWVNINSFKSKENLSSLPIIAADSLSPMQKFTLRPATETETFSASTCDGELPAMLYIQAPDLMGVKLVVNNQEFTINSTLILRVLQQGKVLQVIVLSGQVILGGGTPNEKIVDAGYMATICLNDDNQGSQVAISRDTDLQEPDVVCQWTDPVLVSQDDLQQIAFLTEQPDNLLLASVQLPEIICASGVGQPACEVRLGVNQ